MKKIFSSQKMSEMIQTEERVKTIQEPTVHDVAKAFLRLNQ
ncbi:hypothetical protein P7H20_23000 [Paenibacillus larvae]|nr:hypothetical protein [Paenibacillus larvae]MDT2277133.1 hypothetical protein [Paenibacillus larvae]